MSHDPVTAHDQPLDRTVALELLARGADQLDARDPEGALESFAAVATRGEPELGARAAIGAAEALSRMGRDGEARERLAWAAEQGDREARFVALRRHAALAVQAADLPAALALYRRAEPEAPTAAERAEVASRIGWLTQETGGSTLRSRAAFRRARGEPLVTAGRLLLAITALGSLATLLLPNLALELALVKVEGGLDWLAARPWTLFTVTMVHGGIQPPLDAWVLHLGFNLIAMDIGARLVERLYGARRLLLWYALGAIGASLASAIFLPDAYSVGASGGVFALFGVALGAEWAHKPLIEQGARYALSRIGVLIAVNLAIGFGFLAFGGGIDNAAHLGGLVVGLVFGALVAPTRAESMRRRWSAAAGGRLGEVATTGLVLILLWLIYANWLLLADLRASLPL